MPEVKLVQGSDSWHAYRSQHVMATDASIIMKQNPYKDPLTLWKQKLGIVPSDFVNSAMQRGSFLEPKARRYFENLTDLKLPPIVWESDINPWMAASLDGFDGRYLLEIKCPGEKVFSECRNKMIPEYWWVQIQHQLAVTGLEWAYLFVFDGEDGFHREIERDPEYINKMVWEEEEFYRRLQEFDPPPEKYTVRHDSEWMRSAHSYSLAKAAYEEAKRKLEIEKMKLLQLSREESCEGGGVRICRYYSKGQVDYKAIPEIQGLNLEKYRKPGSERVTVTIIKEEK